MKNIRLNSLCIHNFKGCKSKHISFNDNKTVISGVNASGKTTIVDAFMWTLFNKDSAGNTSFGIRPVDETGKEIDNIEISIEAVLSVNGMDVSFKKVQKQKWTKHRGSLAPTYEGNVNTYEVNGFPQSEKEYKAKIGEIISEDDFRLISDIRYFSGLEWKKKKEILLRLCGDVTDDDVLAERPEYWLPIESDVKSAGTEKSKDKAKKEFRELNKTQKELPVRIDEATMQLADDIPTDDITAEINSINAELDGIPKKIPVPDTSAMEIQIKNLENRISEIKEASRKEADKASYAHLEKLSAVRNELNVAEANIRITSLEVTNLKARLDRLRDDLKSYGNIYKEAKERRFDEKSTVCRMCGQILPAGKVEQIKTSFTEKKEADTQAALAKGWDIKNAIQKNEEEFNAKQNELSALEEKASTLRNAVSELESAPIPVAQISPENKEKIAEIESLISEIRNHIAETVRVAEAENKEADAKRYTLIEHLNASQNRLSEAYAVNNANDKTKARIKELTDLQVVTGQKIALAEQKLILLEEFSIRKSELLSKKITSQFELTNFSLFSQQINGGLVEECEITYKGVKYRDMNSGHRIAVALDIIRTFQNKLDIHCPVFVDNAETINEVNIPEMPCQLILLKVSDDKELTIE